MPKNVSLLLDNGPIVEDVEEDKEESPKLADSQSSSGRPVTNRGNDGPSNMVADSAENLRIETLLKSLDQSRRNRGQKTKNAEKQLHEKVLKSNVFTASDKPWD